MKRVCVENACTGCMACIDACAFGAVRIEDSLQAYNAVIDENKCTNCQACMKVCQNNQPVSLCATSAWKQGWASDIEVRKNASSGGAATAILRAFVAGGGVAYSCAFADGEFGFFQVTKENIDAVRGSKYVKSNPRGVYAAIKMHLKKGENVLFIGLPCQVAAVKLFTGDALGQNLYTIDLICHGTPSPKFLDMFLQDYKGSLSKTQTISFREKHNFRVQKDGSNLICPGCADSYILAFLNGISYTENCYQCRYAQGARVGDITLGDSWGSELPIAEQKKGVSLFLIQTQKGEALLNSCDLQLYDVDVDKAKAANGQLNSPSKKPPKRKKFFRLIEKGKPFKRAVFACLPKACIKQKIKAALIRLGIKKA